MRDRSVRLLLWAAVFVSVALGLEGIVRLYLSGKPQEAALLRSVGERARDARKLNNLLLRSPATYPRPKAPDEYTVGLFGGSVAADVSRVFEDDGFEIEKAEEELSAAAGGKRVVVINMTIPAGRQPIQNGLLSTFPEMFDAVLFLDGYNELLPRYLAESPRRCLEMSEFRDTAGQRGTREARLASLQQDLSGFVRPYLRMDEEPLKTLLDASAVARFLVARRAQDLNSRALHYLSTLSIKDAAELPARVEMSRMTDDEDRLPLRDPPQEWADCLRAAHGFAAAHGIRSLFFLQPYQYVLGSKTFTDEERRVAFVPGYAFEPTRGRLPTVFDGEWVRMREEAKRLAGEGVPVDDLALLFEHVPESVYVDSCCHLNRHGSDLVGAHMIRRLTAQLVAGRR